MYGDNRIRRDGDGEEVEQQEVYVGWQERLNLRYESALAIGDHHVRVPAPAFPFKAPFTHRRDTYLTTAPVTRSDGVSSVRCGRWCPGDVVPTLKTADWRSCLWGRAVVCVRQIVVLFNAGGAGCRG